MAIVFQLKQGENVHILIVLRALNMTHGRHFFFHTETINTQIVGDTKYPGKEFTLLVVIPALERVYDLEKCFLENVLGNGAVADQHHDITEDPLLVTADQKL